MLAIIAEKKSMKRSRKNRDGIRRTFKMLRQPTDKKKTPRSYLMPRSSLQKELEVDSQTEQEARDAQSTTELRQNQPSVQNREQLIRSRSQKGNSEKEPISPSQQRPPAYQVSNLNANQSKRIDGTPDKNYSLSEDFRWEGQREEVPPPNHLIPKSNISSQQKDAFTSNSSSFHVRVSIGYMTGLKIDKIVKRTKQPTNNRITVGFVELASSGKYTALSQPLLTNVEEKAQTTNILWASRRDGEEISKSKSRRRLHFSLSLDRKSSEFDPRDNNDDNSVRSRASFVPEVVKLLVGLKCGDERIPLGIANFVVNGREKFEQKMDLIVLPVPGLATGPKTKRGIFGKKQRGSFTNGELTFKVTPNAKLRVKADVKIGYPGQDGAEIWGDNETSYTSATKWTFASRAAFSSGNGPSPTHGLSFSTIKTSPVKRGERKNRSNASFKKQSQNVDKNCNSMHTSLCISKKNNQQKVNEVPMRYVSIDSSNELVSVMSDMTTRADCQKPWSCAHLFCGGDEGQYRELFPGSSSFESNQMMENEIDGLNDELRTFNFSAVSSWDFPTKLSAQIAEKNYWDTDDDSVTLEVPIETQANLRDANESVGQYENLVESKAEKLFENIN